MSTTTDQPKKKKGAPRPFETLKDVEIISRLGDRLDKLPLARRARILGFMVEQLNEEMAMSAESYREPCPTVDRPSPFDQ